MSYIALYRKWRPLVFEDVVEQEHVVKTLRQSILDNRIAHTYLFCGTRGTGKTSMAKIFSRAINCINPKNGDPCNECEICKGLLAENILDVIEIDAASNNGVDNVRQIRDEVIYAPSKAKYKVYIIDEVHMLSAGAFNALLKTLEEPPANTVFVLATTEPGKVPATILSRCQRFDFRRISIESIQERLAKISIDNEVQFTDDALLLIARLADGSLRDAISILDQCISIGKTNVSYNDVVSLLGIVNDKFLYEIVECVREKNVEEILFHINELVAAGKDIRHFISDLILYYRNLLICKFSKNVGNLIKIPKDDLSKMVEQSKKATLNELYFIINELSVLESNLKWLTMPKTSLEVTLIKLCEHNDMSVPKDLDDRLNAIEEKITQIKNSKASETSEPVKKPIKIELPKEDIKPYTIKKSSENFASEDVLETHEKIENIEEPEDDVQINNNTINSEIKEKKLSNSQTSNSSTKRLQDWQEIIDEIKSFGRMKIYMNLMDSTAYDLGDNLIGISFDKNSKLKENVIFKAENIHYIESIIEKRLGKTIKIKCLTAEDFVIPEETSETIENDVLSDRAMDIVNKLNIDINVIDE